MRSAHGHGAWARAHHSLRRRVGTGLMNTHTPMQVQGQQAKEEAIAIKEAGWGPASGCGCLAQALGEAWEHRWPIYWPGRRRALGGAYSDVRALGPGGSGTCPGRSWGLGVGPGRRGRACGRCVVCCGPPWVLCVVLCCSVRWPFFIFFGLALPFCGAVWLVRPPALGPVFRAPPLRPFALVFLWAKS